MNEQNRKTIDVEYPQADAPPIRATVYEKDLRDFINHTITASVRETAETAATQEKAFNAEKTCSDIGMADELYVIASTVSAAQYLYADMIELVDMSDVSDPKAFDTLNTGTIRLMESAVAKILILIDQSEESNRTEG